MTASGRLHVGLFATLVVPDPTPTRVVTSGDDSQWIIVNDDDEVAVTTGDPHQLERISSFAFSEVFSSQLSFRSDDCPRLVLFLFQLTGMDCGGPSPSSIFFHSFLCADGGRRSLFRS